MFEVKEAIKPLEVVSYTPTEAVEKLETITITFSDEIEGTFVATEMNQIYLKSQRNGCSYEVNGNVLTITPFSAITAAGEYPLTIPSGLITRKATGEAVEINGDIVFTVKEAAAELDVLEMVNYERNPLETAINGQYQLKGVKISFTPAAAEGETVEPVIVKKYTTDLNGDYGYILDAEGNEVAKLNRCMGGNGTTNDFATPYSTTAIETPGTYKVVVKSGVILSADGTKEYKGGEFEFTVAERAVEISPSAEDGFCYNETYENVADFSEFVITVKYAKSDVVINNDVKATMKTGETVYEAAVTVEKSGTTQYIKLAFNGEFAEGRYTIDVPAGLFNVDGTANEAYAKSTFTYRKPQLEITRDFDTWESYLDSKYYMPTAAMITIANAESVEVDETKVATITFGENVYNSTVSYYYSDWSNAYYIEYKFEDFFAEGFEFAKGDYTFTLPASAYTVNGVANEEAVKAYTYGDPIIEEFNVTEVLPANGSTVEALDAISISFSNGAKPDILPVTCGDKTYYFVPMSGVYVPVDLMSYEPIVISEPGTYTLDLSVLEGLTGDKVFSWTIEETATVPTESHVIDLTFNKVSDTEATVYVVESGVETTVITASVTANSNWKALAANNATFPNASMLCPDKNTKDMTAGNEGIFTITLNNVPEGYSFNNISFTSAALNGGGEFQGDDANAQLVNFTLKQGDVVLGTAENVKIKVNSNAGESVNVPFEIAQPYTATDGTLVLQLVLSVTEAKGCFYGLTKISINAEAPVVTPTAPTLNETVVFDFANNNWGIPTMAENNYNNLKVAGDYTDGTNTIHIDPTANNGSYIYDNGFLKLGKTGTKIVLPAFDFAVEKIEVVGHSSGSSYPNVDMNVYVGATAVSTACIGTTATSTFAIAADNQAAGNVYELVIGSNGASSSYMHITYIKVYPAENKLEAPVINLASGVYVGEQTVNVHSATTEIEGVTDVTYYYTTDGNEPTTEDEESVDGNITITNSCTLKVIVELTLGDKTYVSASTSAEYIITEEATYHRAVAVEAGNYFLVADGKVSAPIEGTTLPAVEVTVDGNDATAPVYYAITLEETAGGYYIKDVNGKYIYNTMMSPNKLSSSTYAPMDAWTIEIADDENSTATIKCNGYVLALNKGVFCTVQLGGTDVPVMPTLYGTYATGINEAVVNGEAIESIYDLTGRRVEKITKSGIYIVNGKKVLVK